MTSTQDPLSELEDVAPCKELTAIVDGAFTSIQMSKPWREATTNHPQLQQVIQKIQGHSVVYFKAIDTSIKTAQDGYGFSCDAIELCEYLLDPETDPADLQEYISDMQSKAKQSKASAPRIHDNFEYDRGGAERVVRDRKDDTKGGVAEDRNKELSAPNTVVYTREHTDLDAAMKKLGLAPLDMTKLADNLDRFADWWGGMRGCLGKTETDASALRPGKDKLRVKGIMKAWTGIRDDYKQYKVKIIQLQDCYLYVQGIVHESHQDSHIFSRPDHVYGVTTASSARKDPAVPVFSRQQAIPTVLASSGPLHDPLKGLDDIAPCKELGAIAIGALEVLKSMDSWHGASTTHPRVQIMIRKIQDHVSVYFGAIDTSIKTAQDGYGFSCDAIDLCSHLLNPEMEHTQLQGYIKDMQDKAKDAHGDCLMTVEQFRAVRKGLIEITKTLPKEVVLGEGNVEGVYIRLLYRALGKEEYVLLDGMINNLNQAALKMGNLAENVNMFTAWWVEMETALGKAMGDVRGLKPGKDTLRVKGIQNKWTNIRDDYRRYKVQITEVQDHYPEGRRIGAPN